MKLSKHVKPIEYLRCHTAEAVREVADRRQTLIITQRGEAKVVLQDIATYEQTLESLALLKILAESSGSLSEQHSKHVKKAFADARRKIKERSD